MNSAHTRFVSATPSTVTVEVLISRCGMLINWTFGARSRNSQLKMNNTMSAGDSEVVRTANLSCISSATVTAALEKTNSMPAEARLLMNMSSISTIKSARNTFTPRKCMGAFVCMRGWMRSVLIDNASDDVYSCIGQHLHRARQLCLGRAVAPCNHHRTTGVRREDLRVRRFADRGRIEDYQTELSGEVIQNHIENRAREQFLRIRRKEARRQHE